MVSFVQVIQLMQFDLVVPAFNKPAALPDRVGESGEDQLRRHRISTFDNESAVNNRLLFHRLVKPLLWHPRLHWTRDHPVACAWEQRVLTR